MTSILDDVAVGAELIAQLLRTAGYQADFGLASLAEVDRFLDDHSADGVAVPGGLLAAQLGQRLFGLGCYVGEVVRRNAGGAWEAPGGGPERLRVVLGDGSALEPVALVRLRFTGTGERIEVLVAPAGVS